MQAGATARGRAVDPVRDRSARRRGRPDRWSPSAPGIRRSRAASRTRSFMSSESHSSMTRSSPSRKQPRFSGRMPSGLVITRRYGSISPIRRAATTALFTPRSRTLPGMRLRLDSSTVSKSASRSSPARPSMARTWAIECPALRPTTPMRRVRCRACSGPGHLVAVAIESQRVERTRAEQPHHGPPPGVVDPSGPFLLERRARAAA